MLDKHFTEMAKDGPSRNTRSRQGRRTGRLTNQSNLSVSDIDVPCMIRLADGSSSIIATGRCDDGSDDTIVSSKIAEQAAMDGIGKISRITPVKIQVDLSAGGEAQELSFYTTWTCPRIFLHLAAGQLALFNVRFLVADGVLSSGDLIVGLPVLQHLKVDNRTLLEKDRASLDGTV